MIKKLMTILTILAVAVLVAPAAYAGKVKQIEIGTGQSFTPLPADSQWHEMMRVSLTTKKGVTVCVVTASWTSASLNNNIVLTTLATQPDALGSWVQGYEGLLGGSGAMTQAFEVTPQTPVTFYMNGINLGNSDLEMENTRIWCLCGKDKIPSTSTGKALRSEETFNQ